MVKHYTAARVSIETLGTPMKVNQPRRTVTTLVSNPNRLGKGAQFVINERVYTPRPERQWKPLGRTLHLMLKSNATHVQILGYIRREDIPSNASLADILGLEMEQLSDQIVEMEDLSHE